MQEQGSVHPEADKKSDIIFYHMAHAIKRIKSKKGSQKVLEQMRKCTHTHFAKQTSQIIAKHKHTRHLLHLGVLEQKN